MGIKIISIIVSKILKLTESNVFRILCYRLCRQAEETSIKRSAGDFTRHFNEPSKFFIFNGEKILMLH